MHHHFPFELYLSKAKEYPEYYDNKKSCNFDDQLLLPVYYPYSHEEFFAISNRLCTFTINDFFDLYKDIDNKEDLHSLIFISEMTWKTAVADKNYAIHEEYPPTEYFFEYLNSKINKITSHPQEELEQLKFDVFYKTHYPFDILKFNENLLGQIQSKYVNGNQEEARKMWRKLYLLIKPYELQVNHDFSMIALYEAEEDEENDFLLSLRRFTKKKSDIELKLNSSVKCMKFICEQYHEIVEPFEVFDFEEQQENTITCSLSRRQVMYLVHKAGLYKDNGTTMQWGAVLSMLENFADLVRWQLQKVDPHIGAVG